MTDRTLAPRAPAAGSRRAWPQAAGRYVAGHGPGGPAGAAGGLAEDPAVVFRSVVGAALGWGSVRGSECGPDCVLGCGGVGRSRMFRAVPGQVRAVREFVRLVLAGHPAAADAVVVASELASNTVAHSGSGRVGGMFTVHATAIGQAAAGLAVTELRGDGFPQVRDAGPDEVSGRGLAIVRALTSLFWVSDGEEIRILLATIPSSPGQAASEPCGLWHE